MIMTADNSLCLGPWARLPPGQAHPASAHPQPLGSRCCHSPDILQRQPNSNNNTNTWHFLSAGPSSKCSLINLFNRQQPSGWRADYLSWTDEETEAQRAHREVAEPGLEPRPPGPSFSVSTDRARVAVTSLPTWAQGLCLFSPGGSTGSQT